MSLPVGRWWLSCGEKLRWIAARPGAGAEPRRESLGIAALDLVEVLLADPGKSQPVGGRR
nr:hypothetical protein [Rhodococcus opacus]